MEFIYVGNPAGRDARSDIMAFGYTFAYGVPVEIREKWIAEKLAANSHFREKRALTVAPGAVDIETREDADSEPVKRGRGRPPMPKVAD